MIVEKFGVKEIPSLSWEVDLQLSQIVFSEVPEKIA